MFTRRDFVVATAAGTAAVAVAPLFAQEKAARTIRIGVLDLLAEASNAAALTELRKALQDAGYVEGKNLRIEYRSAEGRLERFPALAAELAHAKVDCFIANGTPAALAAKAAPGAIPVVTALTLDPVETGLVASLDKPGGNVTGVAVLTAELETRRLELLRALAPGRKRVAMLVNMGNPALAATWKVMEAAAAKLGMQAQLFDVRKPVDIRRGLSAAKQKQFQALVMRTGGLAESDRDAVVAQAAELKLPAIYAQRSFVESGGMASYGLNLPYQYGRTAAYVDRIVKGAKPGEIAMEQPTKFELVINRRAIRALGLVIPPDLLLRSDDVVG
jgi:putative tryptophan/tyrosine transport system substrate-binding protein